MKYVGRATRYWDSGLSFEKIVLLIKQFQVLVLPVALISKSHDFLQ